MAKLYFYYSAMNAGKSTNLLQSSYNYMERGMETLLYTPAVDDREELGVIHSRIGLTAHAVIFDKDFDLFEYAQEYVALGHPNLKCVLVDEAHFLSRDQVAQLTQITDEMRIPVLCYGLRTDFRGDLFAGSQYLLAWAEELVEIKTICHCGRKATMNMRIDEQGRKLEEGAQVHIGGNESYVSTCRIHFKQGQSASSEDAAIFKPAETV